MSEIDAEIEQQQQFLQALRDCGGKSGNKSLRDRLHWDEDQYWTIQGQLIEKGAIALGRGKGGSVRLPVAQLAADQAAAAPAVDGADVTISRERDLYAPLKASIESKWIKRFGFDEFLVDETHSRGSRDTGGTFTRPDVTAAGIRRYLYLPKRLEIVTFEIKASDSVNITGVLEAIAHREAAHRVYVMYAVSRVAFDDAAEAERIIELGQKFGIGVLLTEQPDDVETWEILLDALRHEPDPSRLDRFLSDLPSATMKNKLARWKD